MGKKKFDESVIEMQKMFKIAKDTVEGRRQAKSEEELEACKKFLVTVANFTKMPGKAGEDFSNMFQF